MPSDSDGGALWPWLVVLGGAAAGVVGFLWYRSQQEPPIDGEGGPGEPQPPVGPGEVEEIPPGAAATGAEGATPEDSIFPSADAPPEAATPPQPGPDEVAGADASDAEAAEAADVSGPSDETEPVDYGTSQGAPGPDRDPDAGSRA